ncbi:MAG: PH domain-containing protein [Gelidibacter sp.]|uniref:PH domain-containing protein n=1 Tax=Gelidibacter sp. TaxID=2018083 RepID=UPI0032637A2F
MRTEIKTKEKVVLTLRKHWFTLIEPLIWFLLFLTLSLITFKTAYGIFCHIGTALTIIWFTYKFMDRQTNIWVVTNLRIIDEYGVFSVNSKESPLDKINNVSYHQPFIGRVFGYGDVQIQTAAEMGSTTHKMVEKPRLLKDTITKCQDQYRQSQIQEQALQFAGTIDGRQNPKSSIADELTKLHDLKVKGILSEDEFDQLKKRMLSQY